MVIKGRQADCYTVFIVHWAAGQVYARVDKFADENAEDILFSLIIHFIAKFNLFNNVLNIFAEPIKVSDEVKF